MEEGVEPLADEPERALELESYQVTERNGLAPTSLIAPNRAMRFSTQFTTAGPRLTPRPDGWSLGLTTARLRCGQRSLEISMSRVPTRTSSHRVAYRHHTGDIAVEEGYENGPAGLEQTFVVSRSPCKAGELELAIDVTLDGLSGTQTAHGADLVDKDGKVRLSYTKLLVRDASGAIVPARLSVRDRQITISAHLANVQFPLLVDPLVAVPSTKLVAGDGAGGDRFGWATSFEGDTAVVGSLSGDNGTVQTTGSAYVFTRTGSAWSQQAELVPNDGLNADEFGHATAVSGNTALIGAPFHSVAAVKTGAAYVYVRSGTTWAFQKQLLAGDGLSGDEYGRAVAVSGDTAFVGARFAAVGANANQGAVYVYVRTGTTWSSPVKLVASDGAAGNRFGSSVSVSGTSLVVGAPGAAAAYVYTRPASTWTFQQKLTSNILAELGWSVAVSGDTALVATHYQGAVVFTRSGSAWTEQQKLASQGTSSLWGLNAALHGDVAALGDHVGTGDGEARVFLRSGSTWSAPTTFTAPDLAGGDRFGRSVALVGRSLLVGSYYDDGSKGSVYPFTLYGGIGDPCSSDGECESQHCVENVCCNVACDGACQACSKATGADGDGTCKTFDSSKTDELCIGGLTCNGSAADCTSCAGDQDCPGDKYCANDGKCTARKAAGATCDSAAGQDCLLVGCRVCPGVAGDYCVDGFCCDLSKAQCGACRACSAELTGGTDGTCGPVASGDPDPRHSCVAGDPADCDADGLCDGAGACRTETPINTPCGATSCSQGKVAGRLCDGDGQCDTLQVDCSPFVCGADACTTSCTTDAECAEGSFCSFEQKCEPVHKAGTSCARAQECSSSFCVDGYCCNDACDGQCEACGEPKNEGTCSIVEGEPRGARHACEGSGACGGVCDKSSRQACAYPGESTGCGSRCQSAKTTLSFCNAKGDCIAEAAKPCGAYLCGPDACLEECARESDCAAGYSCQNAECTPTGNAKCSDDLDKSVSLEGEEVSCAPFFCDASSGQCNKVCLSSDECVTGYICNSVAKVCEEPSTDQTDDGGCGCRAAGASRHGAAAWLLALGGALCWARRRQLGQLGR